MTVAGKQNLSMCWLMRLTPFEQLHFDVQKIFPI